jgi:hypothetical protein
MALGGEIAHGHGAVDGAVVALVGLGMDGLVGEEEERRKGASRGRSRKAMARSVSRSVT